MNLPEEIVNAIVNDLRHRPALGDVWDNLDNETRKEIMAIWSRMSRIRIEAFVDAAFDDDNDDPPAIVKPEEPVSKLP